MGMDKRKCLQLFQKRLRWNSARKFAKEIRRSGLVSGKFSATSAGDLEKRDIKQEILVNYVFLLMKTCEDAFKSISCMTHICLYSSPLHKSRFYS